MTKATPSVTLPERERGENFPVAGWFIAAHHRPLVAAYYAFARRADDIADSTELTVIQKLARLDVIENALTAGSGDASPEADAARSLGAMLRARGIPTAVAQDLLTAFRADARNTPIRTLAELLQSCAYSANPVGRFLLQVHGETGGQEASDALCTSLQILNHIQDVRQDAEALKRCYIPLAWLNAQDIDLIDILDPDGLSAPAPGFTPIRDDAEHLDDDMRSSTSARAKPIDAQKLHLCLNKLLDEVDARLIVARQLPAHVKDRRLAAQSAVIVRLAQRLARRLRADNPWLYRIDLTLIDWLVAAWAGLRVRLRGP